MIIKSKNTPEETPAAYSSTAPITKTVYIHITESKDFEQSVKSIPLKFNNWCEIERHGRDGNHVIYRLTVSSLYVALELGRRFEHIVNLNA